MLQLTAAEMIAIKRDGGVLSRQMIEDLVRGITDMSLSDAQVGAFNGCSHPWYGYRRDCATY